MANALYNTRRQSADGLLNLLVTIAAKGELYLHKNSLPLPASLEYAI